jgi:hypothetical protein
MRIVSTIRLCLACLWLSNTVVAAEDAPRAAAVPPELQRWLGPQDWQRDTDGPIISLGPQGEFDDTHVFAPCVARIDGRYFLWYSGSTGTVAERVFDLGLATSADGRDFIRNPGNPVFRFGDGAHSILTATLLRRPDGEMLREDGRLRMWFSSTDFMHGLGRHTLHESFSNDGMDWDPPSGPLLENLYAPTILKEGDTYRMWYSDVSNDPWTVGYAESVDGRHWNVRPEPVLKLDADWEQGRLFYPAVIKADGVYLMWYGSYWSEHASTTAIGVAASLDGVSWHKSSHNPVLRPDPTRPWESHYTTSQSVMRLEDGSFRIWYASRKEPPFVNKYFAINTARWSGPNQPESARKTSLNSRSMPDPAVDPHAFVTWQIKMRQELRDMLGIPRERIPLDPEPRGSLELDDVVIEKWIYTSEPGSRVPAVLYRPREANGPLPGLVLTFGHGGSKIADMLEYIPSLPGR